nr:hypothetical protein [Tanacetum cinerariifolium]
MSYVDRGEAPKAQLYGFTHQGDWLVGTEWEASRVGLLHPQSFPQVVYEQEQGSMHSTLSTLEGGLWEMSMLVVSVIIVTDEEEAIYLKGELVPVEQIMEWMEYAVLVVGVESTASWVSFNFKGLCGNEWALVVGTERGVHDQIRQGAQNVLNCNTRNKSRWTGDIVPVFVFLGFISAVKKKINIAELWISREGIGRLGRRDRVGS